MSPSPLACCQRAATPDTIVLQINKDVVEALRSEEVRKKFRAHSAEQSDTQCTVGARARQDRQSLPTYLRPLPQPVLGLERRLPPLRRAEP